METIEHHVKTSLSSAVFYASVLLLIMNFVIYHCQSSSGSHGHRLAPVVQRMNNAIHWKNHYPADSVVCFVSTYPLDSDLSGG